MKITVLNGSPKGATSVTMQYVHYVQRAFPEHDLEIVHVAQRIRRLEGSEQAWQEVIAQVRASDGILWAFPLYILHVHAHYKRFIELIWERGTEDAFAGRYAATLSTSIHFFDNTAHNYIQAICDDLEMKYVGSFSPEMRDLLGEEGQSKLVTFAKSLFGAIENRVPTLRSYAPVTARDYQYLPGAEQEPVSPSGQRILIVTDAEAHQTNLLRMIDRFDASFSQEIEAVNLRDLDIKGSCLGCLQCGYDNRCAYEGKDDYIEFYNSKVRSADILVFAGAIRDRYLSSTWKTFFDRSFFNTHAPSLLGKQFGFIISGPLSQNSNLRTILEAWVEIQRSNLAGFVTDECGDPAEIDGLVQNLAGSLVRFAETGYIKPQTFLGVGGTKVFRDDIWGRLRTVFQADHRAYKQMGIYDFPQKEWGIRALNMVTPFLFRIPRFRQEFAARIKEQMVAPYQKVLESVEPDNPTHPDPAPGATGIPAVSTQGSRTMSSS